MSQIDNVAAQEAGQWGKTKVIIDTDIGDDVDDALALAVALQSPELDIKGISTVFGDTQTRARLAAHVLSVFGREDIPLAAGSGAPLQSHHPPSGVNQAVVLPEEVPEAPINSLAAPEMIAQIVREHGGEITIICLGPLSNIATMLIDEPEIALSIRSIVMMGGTASMPLADWNVRSDARAARIVLHAGVPITMVGLDITRRCQLRDEDVERIEQCVNPRQRLLFQLIEAWRQHQRQKRQSLLPYLHDPLTVAALCQPALLCWREVKVEVLTRGILQGVTVPRIAGGARVRAAVDVKVVEARAWIMDRLLEGGD